MGTNVTNNVTCGGEEGKVQCLVLAKKGLNALSQGWHNLILHIYKDDLISIEGLVKVHNSID